MIYKNNISLLGMGFMRHDPSNFQQTQEMVDYAIAHGINYFESCQFYLNNQCEQIVGKTLSKYPRDSYFLCGKYDSKGYGVENVEQHFFQSLKNCNVEYFDFYLLQACDRDNFQLVKKIFPFFLQQKVEGRIKYLGISFHDTQDILISYLKTFPLDIAQIQINYYDWYLGEAKRLYQTLKEYDIPIISMGPFKGGTLTVKQPPEIQKIFSLSQLSHFSMHFLQTLPQIQTILTGAEDLNQLKENINLINNYSFTENDKQICQQILKYYSQKNQILCSNCKYCEGACPQQIPIGTVFQLYNKILLYPEDQQLRKEFSDLTKSEQSYLNCRHCHACEKKCPQHLPITDYLATKLFTARL